MGTNVQAVERQYLTSKGFTLIELLAVIVILAIIALIATPIILNVIDDTKKESVVISVENYLSSVEQAIAKESMTKPSENLDGEYKIIENGKKIQSTKNPDKMYSVEYSGKGLTEGTIKIEDGKVKKIKKTKIDNQYVYTALGDFTLFDRLPESTLVTGSSFNSKIKSLPNDSDVITSIEFLSWGQLPKGYTLEKLQSLENISVSDDNSIIAYYDSDLGKVYVYSDNLIVFNKSSSSMFQGLSSLVEISFGEIDTSSVTDMGSMFQSCSSLEKLNLQNFDTSNVTSMYCMFLYCGKLLELDLSNFDTSKVVSMDHMFYGCNNLVDLNLDNFDTSNVKSMGYMFRDCSKLKELDLSSFDTSQVTSMHRMFNDCKNLSNLVLGNKFNTSNAINLSNMFQGCINLKKLDLTTFETSSASDMNCMFNGCSKLGTVLVSKEKWVIKETTDVRNMFSNCGVAEVTYK